MWARNESYSRDNIDEPRPYGVKEDISGLSCFPAYTGKIQTELLPVLYDEEEEIQKAKLLAEEIEIMAGNDGSGRKEASDGKRGVWMMPDTMCKVCYNCENPFTIYRRRHHCRMCGQIFCDSCSSFYVDSTCSRDTPIFSLP